MVSVRTPVETVEIRAFRKAVPLTSVRVTSVGSVTVPPPVNLAVTSTDRLQSRVFPDADLGETVRSIPVGGPSSSIDGDREGKI